MLTIYKASAGSGKTFQLARKYIQLLLGNKLEGTDKWVLHGDNYSAHKALLAITFTNKATAEMKKRIIEELALLASAQFRESDHIDFLCKLFVSTPEEIQHRTRISLRNLLENFRDFNVSTIDSFFQVVLRTFARELDLPDNFELRLDDADIIALAIEDLLNSINNTSTLLEKKPSKDELQRIRLWLERYMDARMDEGSNFNLFKKDGQFRTKLVGFISSLLDERFKENSQDIIAWCSDFNNMVELEKAVSSRYIRVRETIVKSAQALARTITSEAESTGLAVIKGLSGFDCIFKSPIEMAAITELPKKANFVKSMDDGRAIFSAPYKKKFPDSTLYEQVQSFCVSLVKLLKEYQLMSVLRENLYPLGLLGETLKRVEAFRKRRNAFLLSDTNNFLQRIIGDDDSTFVYERIGTRVKHFLLDEFQDTSVMQWRNLKPLLSESLSTDNDNLIIGDEKQCIYRFRNSEPQLINSKVRAELSLRHHVEERGKVPAENTNWRSARNIVRFNNTLFTELAHIIGVEGYYSNTIQQFVKDKYPDPGYVDMCLTSLLKSDGGKELVYTYQYDFIRDDEDLSEAKRVALDRMATNIVRELTSGFKPGDIAILVRTGDEGSQVIKCLIELFKQLNWEKTPDVVSGEALTLADSDVVNYIISRMRLLLLPDEERFRALGSIDEFDADMTNRQRIKALITKYHLASSGKTTTPVERGDILCNELFSQLSVKSSVTPKADLLNDTISTVAEKIASEYFDFMDEADSDFFRRYENVYISTFLDAILNFEKLNGNDLLAFIEWWDEKGRNTPVNPSDNANAIKVLTIHKSKGLEYACVHVPFVNFKVYSNFSHGSMYWFDTDGVNDPGLRSLLPKLTPLKRSKVIGELDAFKVSYDELLKNEELDTLNILYVAFTRAVRELIVTVIPGSKSGELKDLGTDISSVISKMLSEGVDEGTAAVIEANAETTLQLRSYLNDASVTIGSPVVISDKSDKMQKDGETEETEQMDLSPLNVEMPPYNPDVNLSLIKFANKDRSTRYDLNDPRQMGEFLHEALMYVDNWSSMPFAVKRVGYLHNIADVYVDRAISALDFAFNALEENKRWFVDFKSVMNEKPVYEFLADDSKNKRPDRLVIYDDGSVDIIDYKFGREMSKYEEQVANYCRMVAQAMGTTVRGFLWFPFQSKVKTVDWK